MAYDMKILVYVFVSLCSPLVLHVFTLSAASAVDVTGVNDLHNEENNIDSDFLHAVFGGIGPVLNAPITPPSVPKHAKRGHEETNSVSTVPEQIHIAYGDTPSQMTVVWSTPSYASSVVLYGLAPNNYTETASGDCVWFTEGNPDGLQYIHRVVLTDLIPGRMYSYKVQSDNKISRGFVFKAMVIEEDWAPLLLVFGDMGRKGGAPSLRIMTKEVMSGLVDAVIHNGDFAYDLHDEGGRVGDDFMNRIETMATRVPYMTSVGNHEIPNSFSHYRYRFAMPNVPWPTPVDNLWYSFNMGKAHFISYSTEVYFTNGAIETQYEWLLNDLQEANKPENRAKHPWIIAFGHRPMYCSNVDGDDCTKSISKIRDALETLFHTQGVDVIIQAHEHSYERLWPLYKGKVTSQNYLNPQAPVHIIGGAAGCNEYDGVCVNPMLDARGSWSAFRAWLPGLYGFGRMQIVNSTHIHWEQVLAVNEQIMDSIWIEQNNHGPFEE